MLVEIFTLSPPTISKKFSQGRATGQSLEHLLIPVGTYSLEVLEHPGLIVQARCCDLAVGLSGHCVTLED